ncbi:LysR family transcriptional regulator [Caldovatus sediminis]|uniref:LysR family transcriptional regulator n=1 Tax=Caldovatus sediminis TaxID=2041189 RepID=A0A8J2ZAS2_9PROT|nr:LysR substrate-binding domain-containing protein [Caldovatus sediminis]GGG31168.1 LysR family transcriptional regulator [Caldovatus sediminis]
MMRRQLPPLAALRVFEAAGRRGGFTAAAEELGVTPSAVSHAVRTLEDHLGLPLFRRDPRGLALTPAGEALLAEASRAFDALAGTVGRLVAARHEAGLRISVAPTFAARWLLPRLPALRRRHPALAISITTEQDWVDLGDGRRDLAIRMAREPSGPGEWHRLVQERLVPVAAPAFAGLSLEAALARLPAIHLTTVSEDWAAWASRTGMAAPPDPRRGLRFDTAHMGLEAAAQGLGVALGRLPACAADLGARRVVALGPAVASGTAYWLVTRPGLLRQRDGRLLAAWLREELADPAEAPQAEPAA